MDGEPMKRVSLVPQGSKDLDVAPLVAFTVQQTRQAMFGDSRPPFRAVIEATAWLSRKLAEDEAAAADAPSSADAVMRRLGEMPAGFTLVKTWHPLPFPQRRGQTVAVAPQSRLAPLAIASQSIAAAVGVWQYDVVRHILCDGPLKRPRVRLEIERLSVRLPGGELVGLERAVLHIAVLPSDTEWRRLPARIKWELGQPDYVAILTGIIERKGPPPRERRTQYWQEVLTALRAAGVPRLTKWQSVRQFWMRREARKRKDTI